MCLQVRCTASINYGLSSSTSASVTTASGGQAVVVYPPGGVASGSPGRVTVFCTSYPGQLVCVCLRLLTRRIGFAQGCNTVTVESVLLVQSHDCQFVSEFYRRIAGALH